MRFGQEFHTKLAEVMAATAICGVSAGSGLEALSDLGVHGLAGALLGGTVLGYLALRKRGNDIKRVLARCARRVERSSEQLLESDEYRGDGDAVYRRDEAIKAIEGILPRIVPTPEELVEAKLNPARVADYYLARAALYQPDVFGDKANDDWPRRLFNAVVAKAFEAVLEQPEFRGRAQIAALSALLSDTEEIKDDTTAIRDDTSAIRAELAAQRALLEQLAANSPGPAPLAGKAAAEVVDAAASAASAGDTRLEEALSLLARGDQQGAAALFRAFAEEKARRIARDRKDAAAAYRNLGFIAGFGNPRAALDAYRRALEFEPDDIDTLLWIGVLAIDYGDLGEADQSLAQVLALAGGDGGRHEAWAHAGRGDVRRHRGDLSAARREYDTMGATLDRLAKADPDNAGWQRDLSVSYDRVGDVLVAQGNLPDALKAFRDSLQIRDRLAKADPDNAGWQRDVAVSHWKIGLALAHTAEARQHLVAGRAIMGRLVERFPDWAQWRRDLETFDRLLAEIG